MIIFGSISTTFDLSFVFEAAGAVSKIGSSLKSNHYSKFSLAKSLKHTVSTFWEGVQAFGKVMRRLTIEKPNSFNF